MARAALTPGGMTAGVFPRATRTAIAAITRWKTISGVAEIVAVRYSGTAAIIGRSSNSTSRRLPVIALPHPEEDSVAVDGLRQRLVDRPPHPPPPPAPPSPFSRAPPHP